MLKTTAYFLLASLIIHTGYSLNCYKCNSVNNKGCEDPIDTSAVQSTECNSLVILNPVCYKVVASDNGQTVTVRDCSSSVQGIDVCSSMSGIGVVDFCETCDSNNCNGASKPFSGILSLIIVSSLAVIMTIYFNA